jgi:trimeric autotransporter adhesin
MRTKTYCLFILSVWFLTIHAQSIKPASAKITQKVIKVQTTEASSGDSVIFKDGDGNTLIKITDEGTTGSITIRPGSTPATTTNKLYNVGSTLYFNGNALGSGGGANSINDLSDAKTDSSSIFLGSGTGIKDDGSNSNTATGINVLHSNTAGAYNTANGYDALYSNTMGVNNAANGAKALYSNTTGNDNTANGFNVLYSNTSGSVNTANGAGALYSNTTGNNNTANGNQALAHNTTGNDNTANGVGTLANNTTGYENTGDGYDALYSNTVGYGNTAIGYGADVGYATLTNATAIGYNAVVSVSNEIRLGNNNVAIFEGNAPYTYTSDSTKKENFLRVDGEKALEKFRGFRLTSWNYKGDNSLTHRHYGIMAQVFFSAFGHDAMGTIGNDTTLNESDVAGINMVAIQALEKRTDKQASEISNLKDKMEELEKRNADLINEVENIKLMVSKLTYEQQTDSKQVASGSK